MVYLNVIISNTSETGKNLSKGSYYKIFTMSVKGKLYLNQYFIIMYVAHIILYYTNK